jgi:hypothetical protein
MQSGKRYAWDWIVENCQQFIDDLSQSLDPAPTRKTSNPENFRRSFEALIIAVEELRQHPQLSNNVPMKSLGTLRWFPQNNYEVQVYYDPAKLQYQVSIYHHASANPLNPDRLVEQTFVHLSKLSDTVAHFIDKTIHL